MRDQLTNHIYKYWPYFLIFSAVLCGMFIDVMDIDSSQYAAMSKEMYETGNWLQVFNRGEDYLDKPPLLFWVSALMYTIFGISHFVFRIIPVLVSFLGVYATYRFSILFYNQKTGWYAAMIYASCQAFFLMNHDVRTDTMLTGFTISAIWQLSEYLERGKFINLLWGFAAIGMALLAKGPIGLMVPVLGIGMHLIVRKEIKKLFDPKYIVGIVIVAVMLTPMCIGLYQQFDAHPEKESGLYFYFWKQSFGRLTGENDWNNNPHPTFLLDNFWWSFMPWALLFIPALFTKARSLFNNNFKQPEYISFFGFVLPFIALSTSKYQLPHYIFILFPLAAVVTAGYLQEYEKPSEKLSVFKWIQAIIILLVTLLMGVLSIWIFKLNNPVLAIVMIISIFLSIYLLLKHSDIYKSVILSSVVAISGFNIFMNTHFYPSLMTYQSGSVIGKYIAAHKEIDKSRFFIYGELLRFYAIDFYSDVRAPELKSEEELMQTIRSSNGSVWLYTDEKGFSLLQSQNDLEVEILVQTLKFHISTLAGPFLNPETRESSCRKVYLLRIERLMLG